MKQLTTPIWDIFCNVVDNWGDVGVCWRLAQQLSQRNIFVRLWIDDPGALSWMRSASSYPVQIIPWTKKSIETTPGQAFIEAFGCHAPDGFLKNAAQMQHNQRPVWINLEYLSAQPDVERLHGLPSPQHFGPAKGLTRWFYYPGFTTHTGGLLRESDLLEQQNSFDKIHWLQQTSIPIIPHAQRISLFSYPNQALPQLLQQWMQSSTPIHLLATPGHTTAQIEALSLTPSAPSALPNTTQHHHLNITRLPYLTQKDFDHLLWSCDLNIVRGEDSWIRAVWANKPFVWQPYLQEDHEHLNKLEAFISLVPQAPQAWKNFQIQWSLQKEVHWQELSDNLPQTEEFLSHWHKQLLQAPDLCTSLIRFVNQKHLEAQTSSKHPPK
ncbi:MAG: elongation factor P maturation arginine rhamnosyltransferase EarP [Saezia sp.]